MSECKHELLMTTDTGWGLKCWDCGRVWGMGEIKAAISEHAALKRDYNELIMAVANKHEGETRHQTALRYILEAEQGSSEASMEASHE